MTSLSLASAQHEVLRPVEPMTATAVLEAPSVSPSASPLTFKAIVLDLDGTMMPSYKTLKAIHHAQQALVEECKMKPEQAEKFVSEYLSHYSFQTLLHRPNTTLDALDRFVDDKKLVLPPKALDAIIALQKEAFTAYDGLSAVLTKAKDAGVPVFIYTNSPDSFAVNRLTRAGLEPEKHGIVALWAKEDPKNPPLSWLNERSTGVEKAWADTVIPYTYKKPDDRPLREIAVLAGVKPKEILFIGEGSKDLESAFCDPKNPSAAFCLQVKGAKDICTIQQQTNEKLRPGAEPLGIDAVESRIRSLKINPAEIMRLDDGFVQLDRMLTSRAIAFSAPERIPFVQDRQLVAVAPEAPGPRPQAVAAAVPAGTR